MARQALLLERTADPKADAPVDADQRARAWQEQRELARAIKRARFLGLLPYVIR